MYSKSMFAYAKINIIDIKGKIVMSEPMLDAKVVGDVIAEFRNKKRLSQEALSGLADIGRTHLSAIERGERKPTLETLYRISLALNIKMETIVREIESRI